MRRVCLRLLAFLVLLCRPASCDTSELEQHLKDQYQGKIFLLRGFPSGEKLRYDASGSPMGNPSSGVWTTDGFILINEARVDGPYLVIEGRRMMVISHGKGFQFVADTSKKRKKAPIIEMESRVGTGAGSAEIDAMLRKVFLSNSDSLAALVPWYWRTCVSAGVYEVNDPNYSGCHFSAELRTIPGMNAHADPRATAENGQPNSAGSQWARVFHVGQGISPPRQIYTPEPQFSSIAKERGVEGVVTLMAIVDDHGIPENIEILSPLGAGLDEEAVRAVSAWKFKPAEKDGHLPVAVKIAVQVNFHLH